MPGLSMGGLGSGMDINGLVGQLVQAERAPQEGRLTIRESKLNTQLSAIGSLKSALSDFKDSLDKLTESKSFQARSAKASDTNAFSVKADEDATPGKYEVIVEQLAKAQKQAGEAISDREQSLGEGRITLAVNGESLSIDVTSENNTLEGLRDAINDSEDNPGVTASLMTDDTGTRLVFAANETGLDNAVTVTVDVTDDQGLSKLGNLTEIAPPQDAVLKIDGMTVTRASNKIDDAIDGVTLDLKAASEKDSDGFFQPTDVTVALDKAGVKKTIEGFVESYNKLYDTMKELGSYDPETKQSGPMQGDGTLRTLQSQLRRVMSEPVEGMETGLQSLSSLGVATTQYGKLELDTDVLDDQLDENFTKIADLFAQEDKGVANKLDGLLKEYTQSSGLLDTRKETLDQQVKRIGNERLQLGEKMTALESRLMKQFIAMDAAVGQLYNASGFLMDLANVPNYNMGS